MNGPVYRVACCHHMCGWAGYRRGGDWSGPLSMGSRIHPDPCPRCGHKVLGLRPKIVQQTKAQPELSDASP